MLFAYLPCPDHSEDELNRTENVSIVSITMHLQLSSLCPSGVEFSSNEEAIQVTCRILQRYFRKWCKHTWTKLTTVWCRVQHNVLSGVENYQRLTMVLSSP